MKPSKGALLARRLAKHTKHGRGCWEWQGATNSMGYGRLSNGDGKPKTLLAHRVAWQCVRGRIPKGMCVCHRCDNPLCVRPSHLFLGTRGDNMRDMYAKGRKKPVQLFGECHGKTTLTNEQVLEIRERVKFGEPQRHVAKIFEVTQATVWRIYHRKTWSHI